MKKSVLSFLLIICLLALCSCVPAEDSLNDTVAISETQSEENTPPSDIDYTITEVTAKTVTETKTYKTSEQTLFTVEYGYPKLSAEGADGIAAINSIFAGDCIRFFEEIESDILEKEKLAFLTDEEKPAGKITRSYEIGFNTNNIFSVIETTNIDLFTIDEVRESGRVFEIFGGKEMAIDSFIPLPKEQIDDMVKSFFIGQVEASPADYFENAAEIIASDEFSYDFYLNEKGVYIFLPYDYIAPRDFGRPNCFLSFVDITQIKK